jgi:hypothetical protein
MLSLQALKVIKRLLVSGKTEAKAGPVLREVAESFGIGHERHKGYLLFTSAELDQLRAAVNEQVPGDIRHADLSGSRTDIARSFVQEKVATGGVFDNYVWGAKRGGGEVPLRTGNACAPRGSYIAFDYGELDLDPSTPIIIVENGEALLRRDQFIIPGELSGALWIYRGHGANARGVKKLIAIEQDRRPLIGFFDMDPKGFLLALEFGVQKSLFPAGWEKPQFENDKALHYIKREEFSAQSNQLINKLSTMSLRERSLAQSILTGEWSLTQEHIAALGIELEMVDFSLVTFCS